MDDQLLKMQKARSVLIMSQPFFGSIALKLELKADPDSEKVTWSDGVTLGYNPKIIAELTQDEVKTAIARPVMKIALGHHLRRGERDHADWNVSSTKATDPILKDSGFRGTFDESYRDRPAEDIYKELHYAKSQQKQGQGQGQGQGNPQGNPCSGNGQGNGQQGQGQGQGAGQGQGDRLDSEVRDYPGDKNEGEVEQMTALTQAAQAAKACGNCPAFMKRIVKANMVPKVSWREKLRSFVQDCAKNDYDWTRPSRRSLNYDFILPSCHNLELGEIVVAVDTSGSVSDDELREMASEMSEILESFPSATLRVVYCNTQVQHDREQQFTVDDCPLELNATGGGGTKFSPVFHYVETFDETPIAMIYFTDLDCDDFPQEPEYPVLWAKVGRWRGYTPPFGEVINVDLDD